MAYIKYKELTKYFNFNKIIEIDDLPEYVTDYIYSDEKILEAYKTSRDKAVFTNKRMILFDVTPFKKKKRNTVSTQKTKSRTIEHQHTLLYLKKCTRKLFLIKKKK